jgi:hypothetical protein
VTLKDFWEVVIGKVKVENDKFYVSIGGVLLL